MLLRASLIFLACTAAYAQNNAGKSDSGNPFSTDPKAVTEGKEIYNRACTICHGYEGAGGDRAPGLAASARRYRRTSDRDLFDAISKGIPGTMMPASGLPDADVWKLALYIRSLRGTAIDHPAQGDAVQGEQIFWNKGGCGQCHLMHGKGGLLGPDLSNIASQRRLGALQDALTKSDHRVITDGGRHEVNLAPSGAYQAMRVVTRDGAVIVGVLKNEDNYSLQLMGTDNQLHLFSRDELREVTYDSKSLMPTDYDKRLTSSEFQDLLAFLSRQGIAPRR